ncbi:hypothetical protein BDP81DRAFT_351944, partial [Colletotrichum phormii]
PPPALLLPLLSLLVRLVLLVFLLPPPSVLINPPGLSSLVPCRVFPSINQSPILRCLVHPHSFLRPLPFLYTTLAFFSLLPFPFTPHARSLVAPTSSPTSSLRQSNSTSSRLRQESIRRRRTSSSDSQPAPLHAVKGVFFFFCCRRADLAAPLCALDAFEDRRRGSAVSTTSSFPHAFDKGNCHNLS